ncbi:MAG: 50S ribosomal protein L13 [Clostridia bacterium]|nr:50S ribosomal protein L13 [Clostridia bacterium]
MRTFMAKASEIERKWYIIDAEGKPLGRVAAQAASILRGKHLPTFTPHADCGDHVIIVNAAKAILTGNKEGQKVYYRHTGWIGGLKETSYKEMMEKFPTRAMTMAIKGMLPGNTLGANALKRLRVYADAEHDNAAQKPELWTREIK